MTRHTSVQTYHAIKRDGLLSQQRFAVYHALFHHGPCTAGELAVEMEKEGRGQRETRYMVSRRLPELRDSGAAYEVMERPCKERGRNSIVWDVTSNLPDQSKILKPKRPSRERLAQAATDIRYAYDFWRRCGGGQLVALEELLNWLDSLHGS